MKQTAFLVCSFSACLLLSSCGIKNTRPELAVPAAPDYADSANWFILDRNADVDLFYITSTETADYAVDGVAQHYADVSRDSIRSLLLGEMQGIDDMYSDGFNFFSPFYRQCTLETFTSDRLVAARSPLAMGDVLRAFDYYLEHLNGGRPYVLMGFSQGAMAVVELLKGMSDEACRRMVAAYVIGWKVTDGDLAASTAIVAAHDSADLGVTVCFNSVRSADCQIPMLSDGNRVAVNPLNWRTDSTPATLVYKDDTLTVSLDTVSLLLCVDGYTRDDYRLPLIGRDGNYHRLDIALYADALRRNMTLRADKYKGL